MFGVTSMLTLRHTATIESLFWKHNGDCKQLRKNCDITMKDF